MFVERRWGFKITDHFCPFRLIPTLEALNVEHYLPPKLPENPSSYFVIGDSSSYFRRWRLTLPLKRKLTEDGVLEVTATFTPSY